MKKFQVTKDFKILFVSESTIERRRLRQLVIDVMEDVKQYYDNIILFLNDYRNEIELTITSFNINKVDKNYYKTKNDVLKKLEYLISSRKVSYNKTRKLFKKRYYLRTDLGKDGAEIFIAYQLGSLLGQMMGFVTTEIFGWNPLQAIIDYFDPKPDKTLLAERNRLIGKYEIEQAMKEAHENINKYLDKINKLISIFTTAKTLLIDPGFLSQRNLEYELRRFTNLAIAIEDIDLV